MDRKQATELARVIFGEMGTISSQETFADGTPMEKLVWKIGEFGRSVGRGKTWETAMRNALKKLIARPGHKPEELVRLKALLTEVPS